MDYQNKQHHFELTEARHGDESSPEREDYGYDVKPGTATDDHDMQRMGKKQQLSRQFHALSIFGLTSVVMFTWQAILSTALFSLINGGRGGTVYLFLGTWILTIPVIASMAEMASMAPTSGGQYRESSKSPWLHRQPADSSIRLGLGICTTFEPKGVVLCFWMAFCSWVAGLHRQRFLRRRSVHPNSRHPVPPGLRDTAMVRDDLAQSKN